MAQVKGKYQQSIYDIIIRYYGTLEYSAKFLLDNPQITDLTEDAEGKTFNVFPVVNNNDVASFNKNNNLFATYISAEELKNEGRAFSDAFSFAFS